MYTDINIWININVCTTITDIHWSSRGRKQGEKFPFACSSEHKRKKKIIILPLNTKLLLTNTRCTVLQFSLQSETLQHHNQQYAHLLRTFQNTSIVSKHKYCMIFCVSFHLYSILAMFLFSLTMLRIPQIIMSNHRTIIKNWIGKIRKEKCVA
jgi:hypothetical protein